jgi:Tfp pilus assembly PilM family ATPase/Tfp pilus assembly protein PilN
MFSQDKDHLSIHISEQSIKVAQVKSSGAIVKVARRDIQGVSGDGLVKELKTVLAGFNPKKSNVICVVPAGVATTKNIEIPSVDPEEIRSIIGLQAGRHTPFSRDEILVGHINLGSYQANYTKALLVIVNRNIIKERFTLFEQAGLSINQVLFAPEGIARFYAKALNLRRDSAPVGIIDVTDNSTNFIMESRGAAVTCRSIPIGVKHLTAQPEEARAKLLEEIKTSVDSYRDEDADKAPDYFVLTSAHPAVKDLQAPLGELLKMNVQVSPFFGLLKAAPGLKKKLEKDFADDTLSDVIAPAVSAGRAEVNLMPEEIQLKRTVEEQSKDVAMTGVLLIVILILVGGILLTKIYFKDAFLNKNLRARYAGQHDEVKQLEEKMRKTRVVRDLSASRVGPLEIMRELYGMIPNDIYLNTINLTEDGVVNINGMAETTSRVYAFVSSLSESPVFDGVKTKSTAGKKDRGKDMVAFEIEFNFKNNPGDIEARDAAPKPKAKASASSAATPAATGMTAPAVPAGKKGGVDRE